MTPREFAAAWHGHVMQRKQTMEATRHWIYDSARWMAASLAWSSEQARAISRHRFPHEGGGGGKPGQPLSYDAMKPFFSSISKN